MSAEKTRGVLEAELGGVPMEEVFEWIDLENVLGSASIAQASQQLILVLCVAGKGMGGPAFHEK